MGKVHIVDIMCKKAQMRFKVDFMKGAISISRNYVV